MNKRQLKKEIQAAARRGGVRLGRGAIKRLMGVAEQIGGFPVKIEVIEVKNQEHETEKQSPIGPGCCSDEKKGDTCSRYKQYIGTKIVRAEPALRIKDSFGEERIELLANRPVTMPTDTVDMGYKVVCPGGYGSWYPQDVFEAAYRRTDGMNFGLALEAAKMGKRIARRGWNGKGQYVELGRRLIYATHDGCGVEAQHEDIGSQALVFVGTRGRQVGWLASQADMLAEDWYIVDEEG